MECDKPIINRDDLNQRRKRIKHIKIFVITVVIILLLLPTICCIFLFVRMSKLEAEIKVLKVVNEEEYSKSKKDASKADNFIVHAAEKSLESEDNKDIGADSEIQTAISEELAADKDISSDAAVYLTFDDGPSRYTEQILDILKEYQIKATFFVIGKTDDYSKSMYKRMVEEGHTIGMHSFSHQYKKLYESVDIFEKDFNQISDLIYETTGYRPEFYRFPGGSSNLVSNTEMSEFIQYLNREDITYFDWNVVNGDATNEDMPPETLISNVLSGIENRKESVVLMHDTSTKENTVKSLAKLIEELKKRKLNILPIDKTTIPIQHIKADSVEN